MINDGDNYIACKVYTFTMINDCYYKQYIQMTRSITV